EPAARGPETIQRQRPAFRQTDQPRRDVVPRAIETVDRDEIDRRLADPVPRLERPVAVPIEEQTGREYPPRMAVVAVECGRLPRRGDRLRPSSGTGVDTGHLTPRRRRVGADGERRLEDAPGIVDLVLV